MIDGDSNIGNTLHIRSLRRYNDQNLWHNQVLENVVNQVDEGIFKPPFENILYLFKENFFNYQLASDKHHEVIRQFANRVHIPLYFYSLP